MQLSWYVIFCQYCRNTADYRSHLVLMDMTSIAYTIHCCCSLFWPSLTSSLIEFECSNFKIETQYLPPHYLTIRAQDHILSHNYFLLKCLIKWLKFLLLASRKQTRFIIFHEDMPSLAEKYRSWDNYLHNWLISTRVDNAVIVTSTEAHRQQAQVT